MPLTALLDTRDQLKAEKAAREALERQLKELQQQPQQRPDLFADPEAWERHLEQQMERKFTERMLNANLHATAEKHGKAFEEAYEALLNKGDPVLVQRIIGSVDPGSEIMKWHKRETTLANVGDDPDAWVMKRYAELMAAQGVQPGGVAPGVAPTVAAPGGAATPAQPTQPVTPPRSVASAPGSAGAFKESVPESAFQHVFGS